MARRVDIHARGGAFARACGLVAALYAIAAGLPATSPAAVDVGHVPGVFGEPAVAARFWREQHTSDCAELAVADVVGEITGREPSEQDVTTMAETTPSVSGTGSIWQPWGFTDIQDVPILLGHYGITAENMRTDIDGLKRMLGTGRRIIAHVNAETLWNRPAHREIADHFVVVTGIDTWTGMVHLNDSAIATGRNEVVPIAVFEQAWATNRRAATITR
ncbi:C39 family peptidase [Candidatus Mycobacterium wuenschmannii]|uniref:C39 family peptidase n=1 Tax=Candidatus Mycobacterium wuenschmannii TaxID=3027808 RepID=A0ABY8VTH8_9MYCO|nr:C39 family peptidase [Candidatus Mycobacterium wuenschmannii]WIM86925.1 C39 family peptidase [Candidatus Mycobacterium wuenschmannii]